MAQSQYINEDSSVKAEILAMQELAKEMSAAKHGYKRSYIDKLIADVEENGYVAAIEGDNAPGLKIGQNIVAIDPRYFRPAEVETLLGDPTKAKEKLGWVPQITVQEMIGEMVAYDLEEARKHALLKDQGYNVSVSRE